jgi:hypothetical protein
VRESGEFVVCPTVGKEENSSTPFPLVSPREGTSNGKTKKPTKQNLIVSYKKDEPSTPANDEAQLSLSHRSVDNTAIQQLLVEVVVREEGTCQGHTLTPREKERRNVLCLFILLAGIGSWIIMTLAASSNSSYRYSGSSGKNRRRHHNSEPPTPSGEENTAMTMDRGGRAAADASLAAPPPTAAASPPPPSAAWRRRGQRLRAAVIAQDEATGGHSFLLADDCPIRRYYQVSDRVRLFPYICAYIWVV